MRADVSRLQCVDAFACWSVKVCRVTASTMCSYDMCRLESFRLKQSVLSTLRCHNHERFIEWQVWLDISHTDSTIQLAHFAPSEPVCLASYIKCKSLKSLPRYRTLSLTLVGFPLNLISFEVF